MNEKTNNAGILKSTRDKMMRKKELRKSARFDEDNLRETLHPENKDYGHDIIDEPSTPYRKLSVSVDPRELNDKLVLLQQQENTFTSRNIDVSHESISICVNPDEQQTQEEIDRQLAEQQRIEKKQLEFLNKRRILRTSEYYTAKKLASNPDYKDDDSNDDKEKKRSRRLS